MTFYRVLFIICFKISPTLALFEEKPDFSTSDLHELHDRKLHNRFMMEQNCEWQSYFWDIFTQENYFVWFWEVFHKSRIPTKLNLLIPSHRTSVSKRYSTSAWVKILMQVSRMGPLLFILVIVWESNEAFGLPVQSFRRK